MNWLLIVVIAVLVLSVIIGYKKGLIKQVLSIVSVVVTMIAVCLLTPLISGFIKGHTGIYDKLYANVGNQLHISGITAGSEEEFIEKANLPRVIKDLLFADENVERYVEMGVTGFAEYVTGSVTDVIFNAVVFMISFAVVFIIVKIVFAAVNLIGKLPGIKQVNKTAGILVGLVEGLIVVWILFAVATMLGSTQFGRNVFEQVNSNAFLSFLYNNNLILRYLVSVL